MLREKSNSFSNISTEDILLVKRNVGVRLSNNKNNSKNTNNRKILCDWAWRGRLVYFHQ